MSSKITRMIGTTAMSLTLVLGATGAVSANAEGLPEDTETIELQPFAVTGEWSLSLEGGQATYTKTLSIAPGSGNLKLYASNSGSASYRVTLQSVDYPQYGVILNANVSTTQPLNWTKNGNGVPSGAYILQVHGSTANPKGVVYLKSADIPW